MAISRLQSAVGGTNSGTSIGLTWPGNTSTGNFIIVGFTSVGDTISSVTDSQSNAYTFLTSVDATVDIELWYAKNILGGTTPTITINHTSGQSNAIAVEYSGVDPFSPITNSATNSGAGGTATASYNAVEGIETVVAFVGSASEPTVGDGYGNFVHQLASGSTIDAAIEDKSETAFGVRTGTFNGTGSNWAIGIAGLLPHRLDKISKSFYLKQGFS